MQYLTNTNTLCLTKQEYVCEGIISEANYWQQCSRSALNVHGHGDNSLIEFESLPPKYRALVVNKYGDPYQYIAKQPLLNMVKEDKKAREFYADYLLADGRNLPHEHQGIYSRQCDWLNMIDGVLRDKDTIKKELKITIEQFWNHTIELYLADRIKNNLPRSKRRLLDKLYAYQEKGYGGLIDKKFGNQNTRKVDVSIERLILSLYCQQTKPSFMDVCRQYNEFMEGGLQVVDMETGEQFEPERYRVNGKPYELKVETVKHYMSKPINEAIADNVRMSALQFSTKHRPFMQRDKPVFAFSMITMDDTRSPFKMQNNKRPSTYKAFDVASEAVVAMVMYRDAEPDVAMIREVHARMLQMIIRKGWVMPAEIQVEQALNSHLKGGEDAQGIMVADVLTAGAVYPWIRFCASRNPQEKYAEHIISRFKYHLQAKREGFQFRPFGKTERYRMNDDSDSHKMRFTYEQIVQMEQEDIDEWNNGLHSNQEKYPGLTRWQVLEQCQNPNLSKPNIPMLMPYIGNKTDTSLRRGYVQVQYSSYRLEDISHLGKLSNDRLTAFWLPEETGDITQVYLYQDGRYICTAPKVERFQVAKAEQTEDDLRKFGEQQSYVKGFDRMVAEKLKEIPKVGVVQAEVMETTKAKWTREDAEAAEWSEGVNAAKPNEETGVNVQENPTKEGGYVQKEAGSEGWEFDIEATKRRAISGL